MEKGIYCEQQGHLLPALVVAKSELRVILSLTKKMNCLFPAGFEPATLRV